MDSSLTETCLQGTIAGPAHDTAFSIQQNLLLLPKLYLPIDRQNFTHDRPTETHHAGTSELRSH